MVNLKSLLLLCKGFWSTVFNSALSGVKTPAKAILSNLSTWAFKPTTQIIGAYLQGNTAAMNRAMYGYSSVMGNYLQWW